MHRAPLQVPGGFKDYKANGKSFGAGALGVRSRERDTTGERTLAVWEERFLRKGGVCATHEERRIWCESQEIEPRERERERETVQCRR